MKHPVKPEPPITWEELNRMTLERLAWLNTVRTLARNLEERR